MYFLQTFTRRNSKGSFPNWRKIISAETEEQMVKLIVEAIQKIQLFHLRVAMGNQPGLCNLSLSYFIAIMCTMLT